MKVEIDTAPLADVWEASEDAEVTFEIPDELWTLMVEAEAQAARARHAILEHVSSQPGAGYIREYLAEQEVGERG